MAEKIKTILEVGLPSGRVLYLNAPIHLLGAGVAIDLSARTGDPLLLHQISSGKYEGLMGAERDEVLLKPFESIRWVDAVPKTADRVGKAMASK